MKALCSGPVIANRCRCIADLKSAFPSHYSVDISRPLRAADASSAGSDGGTHGEGEQMREVRLWVNHHYSMSRW